MTNSKNLLMAGAVGLSADQIKNFICSFRKVNPVDTFVVLVDEKTRDSSRDFFFNHRVDAIVCDASKYKTSPINSRHFFYLDLLKEFADYRNILLTDTRDLVFQTNPFDHCPQNEEYLFVFQEDKNISLAFEVNNRIWLERIYGFDIVEKLKYKPILCGGAFFGSRNAMLHLLTLMKYEMEKIPSELFEWTVGDQPVLNYICYLNKNDELPLTIKENGDIMANLCVSLIVPSATDSIQLDLAKNLVLVNGKIPSMIHQYDRNVLLKQLYDSMYT